MVKAKELIQKELKVINIGIRPFYDALKEQKVKVVFVEWKPPAGSDQNLIRLLDKLS